MVRSETEPPDVRRSDGGGVGTLGQIFRLRSNQEFVSISLNHKSKPMRLLPFKILFAAGGLLVTADFPLCAQNYSIDWYTIDAGGGTSTGGVYSVIGTVGQPDAGRMAGGAYSLDGGFWSLSAVQTPGAPLLSVLRTATNTVAVFWPSASAGYQLQQNTNGVDTVNWSNVASTIQDDGTTKTLLVSPPSGNRFYRLIKP
jgi:hypothetical protein